MDDAANVRLVDPHTKGDRGDDDLALPAHERENGEVRGNGVSPTAGASTAGARAPSQA